MIKYLKTWMGLKTDKRAVTMLEYGLIAALIAAVAAGAVGTLGHSVSGMFSGLNTSITAAQTTATAN